LRPFSFSGSAAQWLALAAGRTGKTPPQTTTIASKPAPYHQGEALSAARIVGRHYLKHYLPIRSTGKATFLQNQ